MPQVQANGITLEVERHGPFGAPALVLIRGLGTQLIHWPQELVEGWVEDGFHVITFDNRDAGLLQKFPNERYGLSDMARDVVGLLDALEIRQTHVLGTSMGGVISQILARIAPERVLSATILMSTSGAPWLPGLGAEVGARLESEPPNADRDSVIAHTLENDRYWGSPAYPFDTQVRRGLIGLAYDRCYCPEGAARQLRALRAEMDQSGYLPALDLPVLVIHGSADRLIPAACGRDIAARIPDAEYLEIAGMGHDIEGTAVEIIREAVTAFVADH